MNIKNELFKTKKFKDVNIGGVFLHYDTVFIKISNLRDKYNAFSLSKNTNAMFSMEDRVNIVEAEIVLKNNYVSDKLNNDADDSCKDCHDLCRDVDWSKVPVDTKILVRNFNDSWKSRYFAYYKDGIVYTFDYGKSSIEINGDKNLISPWNYAKLIEEK